MRKQTKVWTCKNGKKIRICDMEDSHLINTIRMLERNTKLYERKAIQDGEKMLCMLQGEMAIMSVESELDNICYNGIEPQEIYPIYENLVEDAYRRNIL